jgi:hypothetical protein
MTMSPSKERKNVSFAKTKKHEKDGNRNKRTDAEDSKDPPSNTNQEAFFRFPDAVENDTDDNYELWTFRLPLGIDVDDLKNLVFDPSDPSSVTFKASSSTQKYSLSIGHSVENESFRVLIPNQKEDDDDEEDEEEPTILVPSQLRFQKHFNVVQAVSVPRETELAPSSDVPLPDSVRRAYGHVPQKRDLKRRWKPIGFSDALTTFLEDVTKSSTCHASVPETKRSLSNDKDYRSDEDSQQSPVAKRAKINPTEDTSSYQNGSSHRLDNGEQNVLEKQKKKHKKEKKVKKEKKKKKEKKSKER